MGVPITRLVVASNRNDILARFLDANDMSITVTGSRGTAVFADFIHPQDDDRLTLTVDGVERVEALDHRSTYSYQLEAFVAAVREGRPFPTTTADSVTTMELIDACYERAGLLPRGTGRQAGSA